MFNYGIKQGISGLAVLGYTNDTFDKLFEIMLIFLELHAWPPPKTLSMREKKPFLMLDFYSLPCGW